MEGRQETEWEFHNTERIDRNGRKHDDWGRFMEMTDPDSRFARMNAKRKQSLLDTLRTIAELYELVSIDVKKEKGTTYKRVVRLGFNGKLWVYGLGGLALFEIVRYTLTH